MRIVSAVLDKRNGSIFIPPRRYVNPRPRARCPVAGAISLAFGRARPLARPWAGLEDLARSGDWERVLEIAARRADQLPLNPAEAMIAATAARAGRRPEAERVFSGNCRRCGRRGAAAPRRSSARRTGECQRAGTGGRFGVAGFRPRESVAGPSLGRRGLADPRSTSESRVRNGRRSKRRSGSCREACGASWSWRSHCRTPRKAAIASNGCLRRRRETWWPWRPPRPWSFDQPTSKEQWRVAQTLYRHAMYDRAAPMLEMLTRNPRRLGSA